MKEIIKAFLRDELEQYLTSFGLIEDFKNNLLKCHICEEIITRKNLGALTKRNGKLIIICEKPECFQMLSANENNEE